MSFAATLDKRITIQSRPEGSDAEGDPITEWTTVCQVWANIRIGTGVERIRAGAQTSSVQASIRIRKRAGIDAGMRILHGSAFYNIQSAPPADACKTYMDLVCEVIR